MEENDILQIIGNNIKSARIEKGFTQGKLAEKINKTEKFVSMIERGCSGLSLKSITDTCQILDITPNILFNGIINYNDDKDKYIMNSLSTISKEDKDFLVDVIEFILKKNSKQL